MLATHKTIDPGYAGAATGGRADAGRSSVLQNKKILVFAKPNVLTHPNLWRYLAWWDAVRWWQFRAVEFSGCRNHVSSLEGADQMGSCNKTSSLLLAAALTVTATGVNAQTAVPVDGIQKQLSQLFQTAKATADGTDLVTAGAVLVLQKDHLMMDKVDQPIPTPNLYTKGGISNGGMAGAVNFFKAFSRLGGVIPGAPGAPQGLAAAADASREFVAGEKFFVTRIDTRTDGVTFSLMSDPIKDVRYHATLKFPFARGTVPSPDDVAAQVSEVVKVDDTSQDQSAGNQGNDKGGDKAGAVPAETKTIAIGQTRDQVVAMFGVPSKIVQFGAKEIDTFPDMKVTFVQNKVVDVK